LPANEKLGEIDDDLPAERTIIIEKANFFNVLNVVI